MKEIILCKYGEIVLKGLNKPYFESALTKEMKFRIAPAGEFEFFHSQSILYITPKNDSCDIELALELAKKVFGIATVARAAECEKDMDKIIETAVAYLPDKIRGHRSFKVTGKRGDKRFPLTSPEIATAVGSAVGDLLPEVDVDLKNPEITAVVEIRENCAYIHAGSERGAGGIPYGTCGKATLLLSGGIDSPVAGYMMARRGALIEALHFESFPYTSERAEEKVAELASLVCEYTGRMRMKVISLTEIQEEMTKKVNEEYFTLLLRRSMMRLAERAAKASGCMALITGESLGQVASQTMPALVTTDNAVNIPVLRPLIGMDKEEIIEISRKIGTFETSIQPYEDCCTVFTPRHPKTRPELDRVLAEEAKMDFKTLEDRAFESMRIREIRRAIDA
ncbi:MAG: tRNA 4-thiouridine(8) synthase ThiI [Clostridia bacterium]|nr:tRNA 4-thiouridine(8) synthase ThiI [Clostridia bacterium]MBQ8743478.1 tRNA 4-thiouridine(8) synthase ThiI [Clostridia bacterium]